MSAVWRLGRRGLCRLEGLVFAAARDRRWFLAGSKAGSSVGSWVGSSRIGGGERAFAVPVGGLGRSAAADIYIGQGVIR